MKLIKFFYHHLLALTVGLYIFFMLSAGALSLIGAWIIQLIPLQVFKEMSLGYTNIVNKSVSKLFFVPYFLNGASYQMKGSFDLPDAREKENIIVTSNHISWPDSFFLQSVPKWTSFHRKFIYKTELQRLPLIGLGFRLINFIPVDRIQHKKVISNKDAAKLRSQSMQTIAKTTRKFTDGGYSVIIYAEGTRFTEEKAAKNKSKYDYLLQPRAGGFSQVMLNLTNVTRVMDVTITYEKQNYSLWDWMGGKNKKIHLEINNYDLPAELIQAAADGDEKAVLASSKNFLRRVWKDKEKRIKQGHKILGRTDSA